MTRAFNDRDSSPGFKVPWGALSIGLAAIAIASLGTLVVIASVQNIDALSTVALALAVLAFAAQLIVSLAQASAGAQQIAQAERINAATQSALADLRATSQSQLANQKELFTQVLRAALPAVAQEISEDAAAADGSPGEPNVADIEALLESALNRALENYTGPAASSNIYAGQVAPIPQSANVNGLSPRELEVAILASKDMTNSEIATTLALTRRTVEAHLSRIFAKLGVTSRRAMATALTNAGYNPEETS